MRTRSPSDEAAESGDIAKGGQRPSAGRASTTPFSWHPDRLMVDGGVVAEIPDGGEQLGGELRRLVVARPGGRELQQDVWHRASMTGG